MQASEHSNGRWQVQIGANPIIWSNDDFHDLGGDIPLERCLAEMRAAGYAGSELGHKFPRRPEILGALLGRYELRLVSGWHSLQLLERPLAEEKRRFAEHLDLLARLGSRVVIVAECSRSTYQDPLAPLRFEARDKLLDGADWRRLAAGLEELAELAAGSGLQLAYHHHVGTVIQDRREIDQLMRRTERLRLVADTGHLVLADVEPLAVLGAHHARIAHVHLKDVRPEVVMRARSERMSFSAAVRAGAFTVPGDGAIDFGRILGSLRRTGYEGWLVVEAEQDPRRSLPLHYARLGREHVRRLAGV
jgi:inosose dehydratase